MMADDIQFLGNWNSQQASSNSSFVSAIVLTPANSTSSAASPNSPRTYSRNTTSVIHIGRVTAMDTSVAEDRAGFVNPVMSRSHAKITFADSGSAFLIDTHSHHGTSVSRGSGSSIKLAPESPFQLHDGDQVTFGKDVLKNGMCHEPLTVGVKLLRSVPTPSPILISSSTASPKSRNRFGLDPSSESESESEHSDIEKKGLCTGPNAIVVDLPFKNLRGRSNGSENRVVIVDSPSSSPLSSKLSPIAYSESSPPAPVTRLPRPRESPSYSPDPEDIASSPEIDIGEMGNANVDVIDKDSSSISNILPLASSTIAPPWRRANVFNIATVTNSFLPTRYGEMSPKAPQPRKIGRLLNPLWLRGLRTRDTSADASRASISTRLGLEEEDAARLDAEWGVYGRSANDMRDELRAVQESLNGLKREVDGLKMQGVESPADRNEPSLTARTDEAFSELAAIKDILAGLKEDFGTIKSDRDAVKGDVEALQELGADVEGLKDGAGSVTRDVEMLEREMEVLKADTAVLHYEMADTRSAHKTDFDKVASDVGLLKTDARAFRTEYAASRDSVSTIQGDLGTLRRDVEWLRSDLGRVDAATQKFAQDVQGLKGHRCTSEQELQNEIQLALSKTPQSSFGTKRKRGEDDASTMSDPNPPASSPARPYKRLRNVADYAAAGAVGALGAWLGLAYL